MSCRAWWCVYVSQTIYDTEPRGNRWCKRVNIPSRAAFVAPEFGNNDTFPKPRRRRRRSLVEISGKKAPWTDSVRKCRGQPIMIRSDSGSEEGDRKQMNRLQHYSVVVSQFSNKWLLFWILSLQGGLVFFVFIFWKGVTACVGKLRFVWEKWVKFEQVALPSRRRGINTGNELRVHLVTRVINLDFLNNLNFRLSRLSNHRWYSKKIKFRARILAITHLSSQLTLSWLQKPKPIWHFPMNQAVLKSSSSHSPSMRNEYLPILDGLKYWTERGISKQGARKCSFISTYCGSSMNGTAQRPATQLLVQSGLANLSQAISMEASGKFSNR